MNILFTGIGGPTPLGLARSIKLAFPKARCIGVDASPWATSLYDSELFDATYQVVLGTHPDYWDRLQAIIDKEQIDFAFVVPETEILVWAARQQQTALPCRALIPDYQLATFCFDKLKVAQALHAQGLTPFTAPYDGRASLSLPFPCWIRVQSGAGALGALKVSSQKELDTWLSLHDQREDFIVSEYLPGRNYACKLLYYEGQLLQHASAERIDYLLAAAAPSGISGMCARGRLLNRPDLVERARLALTTLSQKLDAPLHGMFTVDFKADKMDCPLITEINIRHVSFNHAFTLGGINFANTTVQAAWSLDLPTNLPTEFVEMSFFVRGVDAPLRLIPAR